ncbi:MAG: S-layer protein, partial [Bacillota bacterium]|nr:S-layer protein [Bacillota bacterium]
MKKVLSMLLTACMLLTLPPVTVLAEGVTSTELSGEITGFDELSTTTMAVPLGTELKDLELPKSLMATVRAAAEVEFDVTEEPVQDADSSIVQTEGDDTDDVSLLSVNSSTKSGNSVTAADNFVIEKDTEATPSSAVDSSTMPADPIDATRGTDTEVEDNEQPVSDKTPSVDSSTMPVDPIDATSSTAIEVKQPISDKTPVSECEEVTVSIPVTWVSTPEYEKDTAGVYVFTPEIEGYTVSADLPEITVTVGEAAPLMMLLATEDSPEKSIADSSLYFREDSGSQQYSTDNSNWTTYTGEFTITDSSTSDSASTNTVVVLSGTHDITLSHCSIGAVTAEDTTVPEALSPFNIQGGTVNLTLEGDNKLYSANYLIAGLHVGHDASLVITADSTGSLDAYCHKKTYDWGHGAGIGGNVFEVNGSITIDGGNINAYSYHGAGIGGGYKAKNSSITINGGNVTAVSGGGCGIGSGNEVYQSGGAVTINGGNINVNGRATTIKNGSGQNVYLATFTEPDGNKNKAFNVITPAYDLIGANAIDGKWYVYLPTGTATAIYGSDTCSATVVEDGSAVFTYQSLTKSAVTLMGVTNGTVEASANATGAITSGTTKAVEGERITITPNADNGYQVDTVSVYKTGEEATIVPVTDYTFAMPAYPVTIRVTTKKIPAYTVSGTVSAGTTSAIVSGLIVNLYDSMDTAFVTSKGSATTSTGGVYSIPSVFNGSYVARVAGVSGSYAASTATVTVNGAAVSGTNITLVALTTKSIAVSSHDHKTGYKVGDVLDVSNLKITVTRSDNSTSDKAVTTDMVS